jgi:hypothetical protein
VTPVHLDLHPLPAFDAEKVGGATPGWWQRRLEVVRGRMEEYGSRTLLTGQLGDLIMGNWVDDSEQVADRIVSRQLGAAVRDGFAWAESLRSPVYTILGRAIQASVTGARSRRAGSGDDSLSPEVRKRGREIQRASSFVLPRTGLLPSHRKHVSSLMQVFASRTLQVPEPMLGRNCSHPYSHRPLVEFMLSLPSPVVCAPGQPRKFMRTALKGLVPQLILKRQSKAVYTTAYGQALKPLAERILREPDPTELARRGFVDQASLRSRLENLVHGLDCNAVQLRHVILLEFWLRRWQQSRCRQAQPGA